jgi:3-deoxy-7-phosphoheptulonate synthase
MPISSPFSSPKEHKQKFPLSAAHKNFIIESRQTVHKILYKQDPRLLLVIGPCSIHDLKGAKEYALKLKQLQEDVSSSFFLVMRAYVEKPRTALGWKGLLHDPLLDGSHRMDLGYAYSRELFLFLAEHRIPAACEFLEPSSSLYHGDLITWGCIGARTSSSQTHRQMAADLPMPIAFKNSTDGNIETAAYGCLAASYPHTFLGYNEQGQIAIKHAKGNPDTHIVLRGADAKPNYDFESVRSSLNILRRAGLPERIMIDCSHDNCQKRHELQKEVFHYTLQLATLPENGIVGMMLESYLHPGNQPLKNSCSALKFGISVTDPCLGWEETEVLLKHGNNYFQQQQSAVLPQYEMERCDTLSAF